MKLFKMKCLILSLLAICTLAANLKTKTPNTCSVLYEQKEAFKVLTRKCNVCHITQNPRKVFTLVNMNDFARKINRHVFVWKSMPKGNKITLSEKEKLTLKNWLRNQLNK